MVVFVLLFHVNVTFFAFYDGVYDIGEKFYKIRVFRSVILVVFSSGEYIGDRENLSWRCGLPRFACT